MCIDPMQIPYQYPYFRATMGEYHEGRQYINASNVRVELMK
jgi:hypothetical protein